MENTSEESNDYDSRRVTFCEALRKKYCPAMFEYDINNMQISPKKREIIMQQQNHKNRVCLILDGCQIDKAGEDGEIQSTCPLIRELDLSNNLLQDMIQVCLIADQLKQLSFINLSYNPLQEVTLAEKCFLSGTTYPSVEKLVLNNTGIQFNIICKLLELFPRVNELHASINQYGGVPKTNLKFSSLQILHFSKNEILCWEDIERLGDMFPSLRTLIVCENPLEEISAESTPEEHFPSLEKLSIAKTLISDWNSLDQLRRLPHLSDIRFSQIPLLDTYEDDTLRRQLLIARLPNMNIMNGGHIQGSEREDSERAFIRYYKKMDEKPRRYGELLTIHGELCDLVDVCLQKPTHVLVNLKGDIDSPCQLKLELEQKTLDFRKLLAQKFNLSLSQFRVFYHGILPEEMKLNTKRLYLYHLKDGDDIELQRLDLDFT